MRETTLTEFASRQSTVRWPLDEYRSWVRSKHGCGTEEAVLLDLDFTIV